MTKKHPYDQWCPDARALDVMGDKWTLLIVRDLLSGPRRCVNLQRTLPGISTEQLRTRLNTMVELGLLTRTRYREVPPRVDYELTEMGRDLVPVLSALARWGWAWQWGFPRLREAVDITALFRLAPAALAPPKSLRGVVELGVDEAFYALTIRRGVVEVSEGRPASPDATVLGSTSGWVEALLGNASSLDVLGDTTLAAFVIDGLQGPGNVTEIRAAA
jgi:DNA-binding HxlR family transcriptional regulator